MLLIEGDVLKQLLPYAKELAEQLAVEVIGTKNA